KRRAGARRHGRPPGKHHAGLSRDICGSLGTSKSAMTCLPSDPSRTATTDRAAGSSTCGDDGRSRSDIPVIVARPLTTAAFAPYGVVVEHLGLERRLHLTEAFAAQPEAKTPSLW